MTDATCTEFYDPATGSIAWVASDPVTRAAAIIDPVMGWTDGRFDPAPSAAILDHIAQAELRPVWILETHIHADHISAGNWLRTRLGGIYATGAGVDAVQAALALRSTPVAPGTGFDALLGEGSRLALGAAQIEVIAVPGHTAGCVAYRIGDDVFVGDTLFLPDTGTARCDFPTGCAATLYDSARRLLGLPSGTRLHHCHDYGAAGARPPAWTSTVAEQRAANIHLRDGVDRDGFVALRQARDATLAPPALLERAIRANLYGGPVEAGRPDAA